MQQQIQSRRTIALLNMIGGIASLLPLATGAQEPARDLPTISIVETFPDAISITPGAAATLTDEEIATYRPYSLHDAFDFLSGVRTIDDDVHGRRSGIGIRGAPSRRSRKTLLLEEGTPINASTYLDPGAHYTPPMERLESVDVLKGAGHVLHGPLNNHGIVNFRHKKPTLEPETTAEFAYGNLDTNKRHLMHTRTEGPVGLVFAYTGMNSEGSFDIEEFQYDDFFGSADWQINDRHALGVSFTYFRERSNYDESNLTPAEYRLAPRKKSGRFSQEFNNFNIDYFKFDVVHDFQVTDDFSISSRVFATDLERARFTVEPGEVELNNGAPDFSFDENPMAQFIPGQSGVMIGRDRYYRTFGAETRMELANLVTGSFSHTLQWGLRAERHFLDNREPIGATGEVLGWDNQGFDFAVSPIPGEEEDGEIEPLAAASLETYQASAISGFIQNAIQFGDWTVTPGVRIEHYTQNRNIKFEDAEYEFDKESDDNTLLLPSISFLYTGMENTQLFANVARGYTPAFARTAEDFPLEPETGINSQIGLRTEINPGLSLQMAAFYNLIQDTVVQLPFTINDRNVVLNAADSESYGFDIGARLDTAAYTGSDYNFFLQAAYNYTRAEFTEGQFDGNRVPEIPEHAGSLSFGVEHDTGWHASATVSHFGSFFTDLLNTRGLVLADEDREPVDLNDELEIREPAVLGRVPSHTLLSARLSYTPQAMPNMTLWVQGRNLTNKLYIVDLENGIRPGASRTVIGGVRLKF